MIFWILTTPRSGSNYVVGEIWRRLGAEPKPMEYFNPESVACRPDFTPDPATPVKSHLDHLVAREGVGGVLAVKMLWRQVQACCRYPDFLPELTGGKIVRLRRRDVIRQGISLFIMLQTGAWASGAPPRRLRFDEVAYDHDAIASAVARMELDTALLDRFIADERKRLHGDRTYRGPPLFPEASPTDPEGTSGRRTRAGRHASIAATMSARPARDRPATRRRLFVRTDLLSCTRKPWAIRSTSAHQVHA